MITIKEPDHSLDTLLDLNGQVLAIDEDGYWVKFVIDRAGDAG